MPFCFIPFEVLITLLGVLLWKMIKDKHMYGFTSLCAFALLAMTLESARFDGRFGYFRLIQLVTSAAAAILLALAARNRERRKLAIAGSLLLMGYFTAAFAYVFLPLPQASPWLLPGGYHGHITVTMKFLLPLLVVLLPLTPPAGVLSLARALLKKSAVASQS
jgi:hypothetical protein